MNWSEGQRAQEAQDQAEEAVSAAALAGPSPDSLLLEKEEREIAVGVSAAQPFGSRGSAAQARGPLATGFTAAVGVLLAVLAAYALILVRHQLLLVLIAAFVAIGLDPAVRFLQRHGFSRPWAAATISLAMFVLLVGFFASVAAPLSQEAPALIDAAPDYLARLKDRNTTLGHLNAQLHLSERPQALAQRGFGLSACGLLSVGSQGRLRHLDTVVVLVLIVYFLTDLPCVLRVIYRLDRATADRA